MCFCSPATRSAVSKGNASSGLVSMPSGDEADSEGEAELTSGGEVESESESD